MDVVVYDKVGKEADKLATYLLGTYPQKTILDADIASFSDGADGIPVKSFKANIKPLQDLHGYGYPWPAGVGVNKFDESVLANYRGSLQANGVWNFDTLVNILNKALWTAPESIGQITVTMWRKQSGVGSQGFRLVINYTDGTSVKVGDQNATGSTDVYSVTTDASKTVRDIVGDYGINQNSTDVNVVVSIGSTAPSAYSPYSNVCPISGWTGLVLSHGADASDVDTIPVSWATEAGTVYVGTLDVVTGELTVTSGIVDLGTLTWSLQNSASLGDYFAASFTNRIKYQDNFATTVYDFTCSQYLSARRQSTTFTDGCICADGNSTTKIVTEIQVKDSRFSDAASFKTAVSGVQLVYELLTPQTYQLDPITVNTLLGNNTIYVDCGSVDLTYRANIGDYINSAITIAVANALNA